MSDTPDPALDENSDPDPARAIDPEELQSDPAMGSVDFEEPDSVRETNWETVLEAYWELPALSISLRLSADNCLDIPVNWDVP